MPDLDRFRKAQDGTHAGFADALRELRAGRKSGHWIWYVFPQLAGLGQSSTAVYYGLASVDEARAYLRDPVLGERLVEGAAAVRNHLGGGAARPVRLVELMGSQIDALKLISCLTLFRHVAATPRAEDPRPRFLAMAEHAGAVLDAAAVQGYGPCEFTEAAVRRAGSKG